MITENGRTDIDTTVIPKTDDIQTETRQSILGSDGMTKSEA